MTLSERRGDPRYCVGHLGAPTKPGNSVNSILFSETDDVGSRNWAHLIFIFSIVKQKVLFITLSFVSFQARFL